MLFFNAEQSRQLDQFAIQNYQLPGILLMKRAGLFAFHTLEKLWPKAKHIKVFCGTGNNGGDGFVVAQLALLAGFDVQVFVIGDVTKIENEAKIAFDELDQLNANIHFFTSRSDKAFSLVEQNLSQADIIIDALLGTGLKKTPRTPFSDVIDLINSANKPVLAIDIPSGLSADSGAVMQHAVKASHTCSFISRKIGQYSFQGPEYCGQIHFSPLFLPEQLYQQVPVLTHNHSLKHWLQKLPKRQATQHKGDSGTLCLIGGNLHMMGAIQLSGLASLKSGAGLVKIITQAQHATAITQALPELMCYPSSQLIKQAESAKAIAIGPGLGDDEWAQQLFEQAIRLPQPKVLDADALKLLAQDSEHQDLDIQANWVLTPHPKEAARLLNCDTEAVQKDRIQAIQKLQKKYGGTIVLKGNGSLIYDGKTMEICLAGNPGMATGGMGDVLTGCITTFLAQGLTPFDAACLGVNLHAHAGDIVAKQQGQISVLPTELAQTITQLLSYR